MVKEDIGLKLANLKELVKNANGEITPEIIRLVEEITTSSRIDSSNSLKRLREGLDLANGGINAQQVIDAFINAPQPPIVQNIIDTVLFSILSPIKMTFAREIPRYIDSISYDKTITRKVSRLLPIETLQVLSGGKFIPITASDLTEEEIENLEDYTINPEFKQLLINGYKPKDEKLYRELMKIISKGEQPLSKDNPFIGALLNTDPNLKKYLRVGTPESDYTKNILDEFIVNPIPQERISVKIVEQAGILKDAFKNAKATLEQQTSGMTLKIQGNLENPFNGNFASQASGQNLIQWNINYFENKNTNTYLLSINKDFQYSSNTGMIPSKFSTTIAGELDQGSNSDPNSGLSQEAQDLLNNISQTQENCNIDNNDELASEILLRAIGNIFEPSTDGVISENGAILTNSQRSLLNEQLKGSFNNILSSFVNNIFQNLINNRLLKPFDPTAGLNLNSFDEQPETRNTLTVLGLLNFLPETPDYLKECNKTLHPLNIDEISFLMKKKFDDVGHSPQIEDSNETSASNPVKESVSLGSILLLMRIMCFEYLLKNIVVFDELEYDKSLTQSPITKEYISLDMKRQLRELGIYQITEQIISNNYDFLKQNNIIKEEDESIGTIRINSTLNQVSFSSASQKFKNLSSAMLRKCVGYLKNLIGFQEPETQNTTGQALSKLLKSSKIYDVISINNRNVNANSNNFGQLKIKNCDIRRFADKYKPNHSEEDREFFIFERFVKFKGFKRNIFIDQEKYEESNKSLKILGLRIDGTTSFQEFICFINDFLNDNRILNSSPGLFNFNDSLTQSAKQQYQELKNIYTNKNSQSPILTTNEEIQIASKLDYFFEKPEIGVRMSLVIKRDEEIFSPEFPLPNMEASRFNEFHFFKKDFKLDTNNSINVLIPRALKDRAYSFIDDDPEDYFENTQRRTLRHYNSIVIDEYTINYSFQDLKLFKNIKYFERSTIDTSSITLNTAWVSREKIIDLTNLSFAQKSTNLMFKNIQKFFNSQKSQIFNGLSSKGKYQLITKKSMSSDKIINMINFYTDSALSNKEMQTLFKQTKNIIYSTLISSMNVGSYESKPSNQDEKYSRETGDIGNPNSDFSADVLWFFITTPILIFKGITQIMDPNIAIASQIVNAASAGLLFPKFDFETQEIVQPIEYPGNPLILPTFLVSLALLPVNVFAPFIGPLAIGPPVTPLGMIFWALEPLLWKLPYFKKLVGESPAAQALSSNADYGNIILRPSEPWFSCERNQDENS